MLVGKMMGLIQILLHSGQHETKNKNLLQLSHYFFLLKMEFETPL